MNNFEIKAAKFEDCEIIYDYILKLAELEKFPFEIAVTLKELRTNLFAESSVAKSLLCYLDNKPIGFAIYYFTFSTCLGKNGLHLEDLYIEPEYHGFGFGKQVMQHLANIATTNDCARFEWWALKTNVPAIQFYQNLGAKQLDEISIFRLSDGPLNSLSEL